jgi:hypothetical protein
MQMKISFSCFNSLNFEDLDMKAPQQFLKPFS